MQTVILAAGEGTRMRPLTATRPKPLLPVAGRPLAAHAADAAVDAGTSELVFVIGYQGDAVREYFGDRYRGVPVTYAIQEEQRGTADAVRAARPHLDGPFAVLNGDALFEPADRGSTLRCRLPQSPQSTSRTRRQYGVLSTDGSRATGIVENAR